MPIYTLRQGARRGVLRRALEILHSQLLKRDLLTFSTLNLLPTKASTAPRRIRRSLAFSLAIYIAIDWDSLGIQMYSIFTVNFAFIHDERRKKNLSSLYVGINFRSEKEASVAGVRGRQALNGENVRQLSLYYASEKYIEVKIEFNEKYDFRLRSCVSRRPPMKILAR
jgi:hypothetical protein